MYVEDLSDAAPTAFEDGSFCLFSCLLARTSIEHMFVCVNTKIEQTFVILFQPDGRSLSGWIRKLITDAVIEYNQNNQP